MIYFVFCCGSSCIFFQDLIEKCPHIFLVYVHDLELAEIVQNLVCHERAIGSLSRSPCLKDKKYVSLIQGMFKQVISCETYHDDEVYIVSVVAVCFVTNDVKHVLTTKIMGME